jgi:ABC-type branched-subunit amino acid transport system substrate-binding protein
MFGCDPLWSTAGLPVYGAAKVPSFNCLNTAQDGNNPMSFALSPGGYGLQGAMARYLCTRSDVKTVVEMALDIPTYSATAQIAEGKPLAACGKTLKTVFFPVTATDVSSYVAKVVAAKPDFVTLLPLSGVSAINIYKSFAQQGIPTSHVIVVESNLDAETLKAAGSTMDGTYGAEQFASWSDTSNPDLAAYLQATKNSSVNPRDSNVENGYANVMFLYEAAKKIGFTNFNSASLVNFLDQTQTNGFPIPLSRSLVIPGPPGYAHERQPYGQIVQLKNGQLNVVTKGTDKGWVNGF